jgi:hypothetical protein
VVRKKGGTNTLDYRELFRAGERTKGGFRTERLSIDFVVDGKSLLETLDRLMRFKSDMMSCLVKGYPEVNAVNQARLLTKRKANSPEGRVLLYICPECGDVGCGAYGARVLRRGDRFVWRDFAYESAGETTRIAVRAPFVFDASAYRAVIAAATAHVSAAARRRAAQRPRPASSRSMAKASRRRGRQAG